MAVEVILPKIDEAMTEGKIIEWKIEEGASVAKRDILFTLETEKVTWETESPAAGILSRHLAMAGDVVQVGQIVAWILKEGETMPESEAAQVGDEATDPEMPVEEITPVAKKGAKPKRIKASPVAKRIAKENNIRLEDIQIADSSTKISKADVLKHIEALKQTPATEVAAPEAASVGSNAEAELVEVSSMRKTIARRMTEAFQTVPHFFLTVEVETDELIQVRKQTIPIIEEITGKRLTLTDLFIKVVTKAVVDVPEVNAYWTDNGLLPLKEINIGVAVDVENGLVVPVIRNTNTKSLAQIVEDRFDLVTRSREGKLLPNEMKGGSLTVSNLGMHGIDHFCPIINPPESCILGIGQGTKRLVVKEDESVIRSITKFTLSIDHRILDGGIGSRFLKSVKDSIENPLLMC